MTTPPEGPGPEDPQQPPSDPFAPPASGGYPPPPPPPSGYPPPPAAPGQYPPPPAYGSSPPGYAGYGGKPKNNTKAIWSLVMGILGFCVCGIIFGPIAIILGQQAKREIAASGGTQAGGGMAQAGFIIGIIVLLLGVIQIIWIASGSYPGLERN